MKNEIVVTSQDQLRALIRDEVAQATAPLVERLDRLTANAWQQKQTLNHVEAARYLGIAPATMARYCRDGKVEGARKEGKLWLIPKESLDGR